MLAALGLSRALESALFEVKGADPRIYLGVGVILFVATLLASWVPARRASLVDPLTGALALISLGLLLKYQLNATWLVLGGAVVGLLRAALS